MEDPSVVEWLFKQTGPTITAVLALYFMQQNHRAYMDRERENAQIHREDKQAMLSVLAENTATSVRLYEVIAHLEKTIERRNHAMAVTGGD